MRVPVGKAVEALLVVAATLAVSEVLLRQAHPRPRVQISRPEVLNQPGGVFEMEGDQPLWKEEGTVARRNEACPREGTINVLVVGTSITFGTGLGPDDPFSVKAQRLLDAQDPGVWCLINVAEPAYVGAQKGAELRRGLERWHPHAVVWELWGSDADHYTMIGKDAYNFGASELNANGLPPLLPLPAALERWLFVHSQLYQYTATTLGTGTLRDEDRWARWSVQVLPSIGEQVARSGAHFGVYVPTRLDQPMPEMAAKRTTVEVAATRWVEGTGTPKLRFAEVLIDSDPHDIAMDPDGHLNAEGHTRLAAPFVEWLTLTVLPPHLRPPRVAIAAP